LASTHRDRLPQRTSAAAPSNMERMMRHLTIACCCCCATILSACQKSEPAAHADSTAVAAAPPAAVAPAPPAALSLSNLAGKWNMRTMNAAGDSTLVVFVLHATSTLTGWTLNFAKRAPVPVQVVVAGDSLIMDAGPYPSVLRKHVMVTTHSVTRLQDGKLVGATVAHYATSSADSVKSLRTEGTRAP
jgi:hypothetical protein